MPASKKTCNVLGLQAAKRLRTMPTSAPAVLHCCGKQLKAESRSTHSTSCNTPAVQAEKRLQDKSRGKKDTQTSDARFDASFELGHRMHGKDAKVGCALEQERCAAGLMCPCCILFGCSGRPRPC